MKKVNPFTSKLAAMAKKAAKTPPAKVWRLLFDLFEIAAAAGQTRPAALVLDAMKRVPPPKMPPTVFAGGVISSYCRAAGIRHEGTETYDVLPDILMNCFAGDPPKTDSFRRKKTGDPWRRIDHWRWIQVLAVDREKEALSALEEYIAEWRAEERGPGYGTELVLALHVALRNGRKDLAASWIGSQGHRLASESFLIQQALCLPEVATAVAQGLFRPIVNVTAADIDAALAAIEAAIAKSPAKPAPVPRVQKRRVGAEYSQVHLTPATMNESELSQVFFQERGDSDRGMSLFATKAGIATPSDTETVDAEILLSTDAKLAGDRKAVQAVAFPLDVRGPLALTSVGGEDEDPIEMPPGRYDVLARFFPAKPTKSGAKAGLRVFRLVITFHPAGTLRAPQTLRLEGANLKTPKRLS